VYEGDRGYNLQAELGRGGLANDQARLELAAAEVEAAKSGVTGTRQLAPEELAAAGYPEGSVVQRDAKGKDTVVYKPASEFSAGEVKGFRDKSKVLSQFSSTLNQYKSLVETGGLKKFYSPDNVDAAKLNALKQSLTFQAKDLLNLGILSKDDYENLDNMIPDATGLGAMFKNNLSFNASLAPLESMISGQAAQIPEQFRAEPMAAVGAPAASGQQYEQTATNPQTGEKIGLVNGKWVPIQ
jgi:hypothetical protein